MQEQTTVIGDTGGGGDSTCDTPCVLHLITLVLRDLFGPQHSPSQNIDCNIHADNLAVNS